MKQFAVYGKGGIGKSTIAAGISLSLAKRGHRVLHIGCDPKSDSSLVLVRRKDEFRTAVSQMGRIDPDEMEAEDLLMEGTGGIDCLEAGGPEAGIGCGGRAVSKALETFDDVGLLDDDGDYDVRMMDVLGDVVCGGFAAPMRRSRDALVAIVVSEEMMAAYAANNVARACVRYAERGVRLAGLVVNLRSNVADLAPLERFAESIGTRIISVIPRDPLVGEAELRRKSIVDYAPESPVARSIAHLADTLMQMDHAGLEIPRPHDGDGVRDVMRGPEVGGAEGPPPRLVLPEGFPTQYGLA